MWVNGLTRLAVSTALLVTAAAMAAEVGRDEALARLRDGNARFAAAEPQAWNAGVQRRQELAAVGQQPVACIVTCSDARVPPDVIFDQSLGDLFVVRLAGNVVTPEAAASVEYAVEHLHVPVVVVLGHTQCGAMKAAMESGSEETSGAMGALLSRLRPAIESVRAKGFSETELYSAAIRENARLGGEELLRSSRVVEEAVQAGRLTVLSAIYDLHTGTVHWQMQLMAAAASAKPTEVRSAEVTAPAASTAKNETKPVAVKSQSKQAPIDPADCARRHR